MNKEQLLEDFSKQLDYWVDKALKSSSEEHADLTWSERGRAFLALQVAVSNGTISRNDLSEIFEEVLRGFAVSMFTVLDGGTKFAEYDRLALVGESGETYGELHDEFVMHLVRTGRLT